MLSTLATIGEKLLEGKGDWARLCSEPKYDPNKKSWVVPILLDLYANGVYLLETRKKIFKPDESAISYRYVNTGLWGPRGKKCCVSCEPKNFAMLKESLFGKSEEEAGSMAKAYDEFYADGKTTEFRTALTQVEKLSDKMEEFDLAAFKKELNFGSGDEAVLFYVIIKSDKIKNGEPTPIFDLEGYEDFIKGKFLKDVGKQGVDYLTGLPADKVSEAVFSSRYNINKVFQTTTFNYASEFNDKAFSNNFQSDPSRLAYLDKASDYVLNKKSFKVNIAGLPHIVLPHYLEKDLSEIDIDGLQDFLKTSGELLFSSSDLEKGVRRELPKVDLFWMNYMAYETDGNSFKIINHIKDVNSLHLANVVNAFKDAGHIFRDYIGGKFAFNLQSVYWIIPVREGGKEKRNEALVLFKEILEQREIKEEILFEHFTKMILCHRYERYRQYQYKSSQSNFDFAAKDAVFKYSALIYALKKLNLYKMETKEEQEPQVALETSQGDFQQRIQEFFARMDYSPQEQAMFYLGRVLQSVGRAQYKKGHTSKPVLGKINFNGMDEPALERLDLALAEKARQYNIHKFTDRDFAKFREQFKEEKWTLSPQKNVFYLMAGYTFGLGDSSKTNDSELDNN